ncbi:hypothetical protein DBT_2245 [Dissulfuribacter thermophilus]|uniref:Uncharacterized protein n=1 Tax=Dissulfuribacter thermophilus TaxID=1156395 RepID=A0A1B9F375_9BACT|nr:hypothetical protein DBT_2245 [Dissulfuribacter thermophilus]
MQEIGFCQKDNCDAQISKGCRHPHDYCQFRQSCIIYFLEKEESKKKGNSQSSQ